MSRQTLSTILAALILTLVGANAAPAADWDSYISDGTVYLESDYDLEDQDPDNGVYYKPVSYFLVEGDELYVLHAERPGWIQPSGALPSLNEELEALEGRTFLEYLEDEGFEWDTYDLENVHQIVYLGSEIGQAARNATDIPSTMYGGEGMDFFVGGSASDSLYGYEGDDALHGGDDADLLVGGTGNDLILGDSGNDTMFGNQGIDRLSGGSGADYVDYGFDSLEDGPLTIEGPDTMVVNYRKSSVTGKWYPKLPTFTTSQGPVEYSETYVKQRTTIKKRYVSRYSVTFYNPDLTRTRTGTDTSQIDLR